MSRSALRSVRFAPAAIWRSLIDDPVVGWLRVRLTPQEVLERLVPPPPQLPESRAHKTLFPLAVEPTDLAMYRQTERGLFISAPHPRGDADIQIEVSLVPESHSVTTVTFASRVSAWGHWVPLLGWALIPLAFVLKGAYWIPLAFAWFVLRRRARGRRPSEIRFVADLGERLQPFSLGPAVEESPYRR